MLNSVERDSSGRFAPGSSGNRAGRPRGSENKIHRQVREMIREALEEEGGVAYLRRCAREHPVAFLALLGKLLPAEIRASVEGEEPLVVVRDYTGLGTPNRQMLEHAEIAGRKVYEIETGIHCAPPGSQVPEGGHRQIAESNESRTQAEPAGSGTDAIVSCKAPVRVPRPSFNPDWPPEPLPDTAEM